MRSAVFVCQRPNRVLGCVLAVLLFCMPVTVLAGPRGSLASFGQERQTMRRGATGFFTIKPRVHLEPVTALELTGGKDRQALSAGEFTDLNIGGGVFNSLVLNTTVSRKLPELWRLRLPLETRLFALDVKYELVGANGRSSRLGSLEKLDSDIEVAIDEIPPRIIGREATSMVVEGGMVMHLKLDRVRSAGTYSGTLTVVINQF